MKKIFLIAFIFFNLKAAAQDMVYLADGYLVPGKILEITKDSVRFKNMANPYSGSTSSYPVTKLRLAFNAAGNYLVFNQALPFSDKERGEFIAGVAKPHPVDIAVDLAGKLSTLSMIGETEDEISGTDYGKDVRYSKDSLAFLIRKNGSHDFFYAVDKALPYLIKFKSRIDSLLAHTSLIPDSVLSPDIEQNEYVVPDMLLFGRKAIAKIQELEGYLMTINSVNSNRFLTAKCINLASELFLNRGVESRVETLNKKILANGIYKVPEYLNRMMLKSGQFSKVAVEHADIDYATKFRKGQDGNYYTTVTFVQKMQGFIDGDVVYRDRMKRIIVIVRIHYSHPTHTDISGWDVYLEDIGVVETEKL